MFESYMTDIGQAIMENACTNIKESREVSSVIQSAVDLIVVDREKNPFALSSNELIKKFAIFCDEKDREYNANINGDWQYISQKACKALRIDDTKSMDFLHYFWANFRNIFSSMGINNFSKIDESPIHVQVKRTNGIISPRKKQSLRDMFPKDRNNSFINQDEANLSSKFASSSSSEMLSDHSLRSDKSYKRSLISHVKQELNLTDISSCEQHLPGEVLINQKHSKTDLETPIPLKLSNSNSSSNLHNQKSSPITSTPSSIFIKVTESGTKQNLGEMAELTKRLGGAANKTASNALRQKVSNPKNKKVFDMK